MGWGAAGATPSQASDLTESYAAYLQYLGSESTPPCSGGVQWMLFPQPISVSNAQMASFQHALFSLPRSSVSLANNRPLQPLQVREGRGLA